MTRRSFRLLSALFAAVLLASLAVGSASAHGPSSARRDLVKAAAATARFHSLRQATKAGYGRVPRGCPAPRVHLEPDRPRRHGLPLAERPTS